jgi:16S rRNA (guanine(966)-N(2))-methyltransferase RsmD
MMRIITGRARGTKLETLAGDATRPTSERAKEAVFSILQFEIVGKRVLDLFAGSGQLGLEAVSRGAAHALLCDASREAVTVIQRNTIKTKLAPICDVICADWEAVLRTQRRRAQFDLVFLDPPYALGLIPKVLRTMTDYGLLSVGAKIVCEAGGENDVFAGDEALASRFEVVRTARYGVAYVTILRYCGEEDGE